MSETTLQAQAGSVGIGRNPGVVFKEMSATGIRDYEKAEARDQ
jgi:hypothetical protein